MSVRALIAALAACTVLSTSIGFAAAKLSEPDSVIAAKGGSSTRVLKAISSNTAATNAKLDALSDQIGTSEYSSGTVRGILKRICSQTAGPAVYC